MDTANPPDWERIEGDYRAGILSLRQIASRDGNVTEGAIRKRAKARKWDRDLGGKIKARADAKVRRDAVRNSQVRKEIAYPPSTVKESDVIEANAELIANVVREHRTGIQRARRLVVQLLMELEAQTDNPELFEELEEAVAAAKGGDLSEDMVLKLQDGYRKVLSLSGRTINMKSLADSLKTLVTLEREVFSIKDSAPPAGASITVEDLDDLSEDELRALQRVQAKMKPESKALH